MNSNEFTEVRNKREETPQHLASKGGHQDVVKFIFEKVQKNFLFQILKYTHFSIIKIMGENVLTPKAKLSLKSSISIWNTLYKFLFFILDQNK